MTPYFLFPLVLLYTACHSIIPLVLLYGALTQRAIALVLKLLVPQRDGVPHKGGPRERVAKLPVLRYATIHYEIMYIGI